MSIKEAIGTFMVPLSQIEIGEDRYRIDMGDLDSLAVSLQCKGQLLPLVVNKLGPKRFSLVEGERRIRAAKMVGIKQLSCITYESLPMLEQKELELILCVQRKNLGFVEESLATLDLVERRRKEAQHGGLAKFGKTIRNKEVALELNMTESRMSENMRIGEALIEDPNHQGTKLSRTEFLRQIRTGQLFKIKDEGALHMRYKESFMHTTPLGCLETINDPIIDLCILHPDTVDEELLHHVSSRLKSTGQVIIFCTHADTHSWESLMKDKGLNIGPQPYLWYIKGEEDYQNYIWGARNLLSPIRPMVNMISAARPLDNPHPKAKPLKLMTDIVKSCTERGSFVVVPECHEIGGVRFCVEAERNIRAANRNKIERDRLILSVVQDN